MRVNPFEGLDPTQEHSTLLRLWGFSGDILRLQACSLISSLVPPLQGRFIVKESRGNDKSTRINYSQKSGSWWSVLRVTGYIQLELQGFCNIDPDRAHLLYKGGMTKLVESFHYCDCLLLISWHAFSLTSFFQHGYFPLPSPENSKGGIFLKTHGVPKVKPLWT